MKKYRVTDEDGNALTVEELETSDEDIVEEPTKDEEPLTSEEIAALRRLASVADKLIEMTNNNVGDEDEEPITDEEEEEDVTTDEDEDEEEVVIDSEEEVIDTDENSVEEEIVKKTSHDSKKGFGSIEKKKTELGDSALDHELEVAAAWAKRYGGK